MTADERQAATAALDQITARINELLTALKETDLKNAGELMRLVADLDSDRVAIIERLSGQAPTRDIARGLRMWP